MRLVFNWRRVLKRSASVILSYVATVTSTLAFSLYLIADKLGNEATFYLIAALGVVSATCTAIIPLARIVKQKGVNDADY